MIDTRSAVHPLILRWQAAWPLALASWSKYTRLRDARLCLTHKEAAKEGLQGSFAMIRLHDQSVVIDLERVAKLGLEDYAVEILAHEIGHHVLAPGSASDQFSLLACIRRGLPTLERHAPMVANLYTDLLINNRLQRQGGLRLGDIYRRLAGQEEKTAQKSALWNIYLRIYENLWQHPVGDLGGRKGDDRTEGDAWLGARLVRVYANDWLPGAGRFAMLMLPYLLADADAEQAVISRLLDTAQAAAGCEVQGGTDITQQELESLVHPSEDPAITGDNAPPGAAMPEATAAQAREPFEYGEILRGMGIALSGHDIAIRYYRQRALPYLVPFPTRFRPQSRAPLMEGLEPWAMGEPFDEIDWLQSLLQSPRVIPGLTTVKRFYGQEEGRQRAVFPVDLDLYVDSSGSMPNPQVNLSYPSLAGAIIALSALRAGASVQVTLWSGKNEYMHTPGFVRDEEAILRILTGFYGGATCFPIHLLRKTFCADRQPARPAHILMISDDGITTMFDQDEQGNSGWDISAQALAAAGGGGTMALAIPPDWASPANKPHPYRAALRRAQDEQAWEIFALSRLEDLVEFAQAFSRRQYA